MRAIVATGKSKRVVELPTWVELRASNDVGLPCVLCTRCNRTAAFAGPKQEDERALGRFVLWHRKCADPALVRAAVEAAARAKARRDDSAGSILVWRRKK